ncbi:uncharacterized protein [Musca autumnalis]|uniref:uncharacterized protein n=1 Tax=Musca autumnalis TaxID=221902 RepID=UPI003CF9745C
MWRNLFITFAALLYFTVTESAKRPFMIEFHNITCTNDGRIMKQHVCQLQKIATNRFLSDETMEFSQDLGENTKLRFLVFYKMPFATKYITFLNVTMGLCELLKDKMPIVLVRTLVEELRKSSNIPYSCPLKKNFLYKLENFTLTESIFPTYTPIVDFTFRSEYFENRRLLGTIQLQGATLKRS